MAREGLLVGVDEEELQPDHKPEQPKTFGKKWENYWYHYKWQTFGVVFAVVLLVVGIGQVLGKNEPDYHIALVSDVYIPDTAVDKIQTAFQKYGRDVDGDGKVEVQVEKLDLSSQDPSVSSAAQMKLAAYLSSGDPMFYIFSKSAYEKQIVSQMGGKPFFSSIDVKADGIDSSGCYWDWSGDELRKDKELAALPELYFGVRAVNGTADNKSSAKTHDECLALLKAYITKTPLQAATTTTAK